MSYYTQMLDLYAHNLNWARKLTADLPPEQWALQPAAHMNHAAWVIGHLAFCGDALVGLLGQPMHSPQGWAERFGITSEPSADASVYPEPAILLAALEEAHARLNEFVPQTPDSVWDAPPANERLVAHFPTLGRFAALILTVHESFHLGQLSAWRRVQGLPRV